MPTTQATTTGSAANNVKSIIAVALLIGGIGFLYAQYQKVHPDNVNAPIRAQREAARAQGVALPGGQRMGPPSEEERAQFRAEMEAALNLTPEQQAKFDEIRAKREAEGGRGGFRGMMREMGDVLTPEQQEIARAQMQSRMKARMEERIKVLPESEKEKFREKLEERMAEGFGPGGRRFGGPGGERGPGGRGPGGGDGGGGDR